MQFPRDKTNKAIRDICSLNDSQVHTLAKLKRQMTTFRIVHLLLDENEFIFLKIKENIADTSTAIMYIIKLYTIQQEVKFNSSAYEAVTTVDHMSTFLLKNKIQLYSVK